MDFFSIPDDPLYTDQIRRFQSTDPGHADLFNAVVQELVNNDAFLKKALEMQQRLVQQYYEQLTAYVRQEIADLVGGAPSTLDTLGEIAQAMEDNSSVVDALDAAVGKKANAAEFDSHVKDSTVHITAAERSKWNSKAEGSHTHDDRYYTESEMDSKLNGKANSNHTHNYAASGHTHDDRYYTESEVDSKLNGKANSSHTHNYLPTTGGDVNGGFNLKPAGNGFGWLDLWYNAGNYLADVMSIFANNNDSFVRSNTGALYLSVKDAGVGCKFNNDTFCPVFASAFNVSSSRRYKENIKRMEDAKARRILAVDVMDYDYKPGIVEDEKRRDRSGVIAEEVEGIIPEAVSYREIDGSRVPDSVDYSKFVPYLIRMVQLQQGQIRELQERISGQE